MNDSLGHFPLGSDGRVARPESSKGVMAEAMPGPTTPIPGVPPTRRVEPATKAGSAEASPSQLLTWPAVPAALAVQVALTVILSANPRFYGSIGAESVLADVRMYQDYAERTLSGEIPYRDFRVEYPPLALPFFILPARLGGPDFSAYRIAFGAEMMLLLSVGLALIFRWVHRKEGPRSAARRMLWATVLFLPLAQLSVTRFDLAPALLAFSASLAWASGRSGWSGLLTGLGVLVKIVPGVLLGPLMADEAASRHKTRMKGTLAGFAVLSVGVSAWVWAVGGPGSMRESLRYHVDRGLEVGSLGSGVLMALGHRLGWPISTEYRFSSTQLLAPGDAWVSALAFPAQALAILFVIAVFLLRGRQSPLRFAGACMLAFVLFGKVLSPQYLLWIYPFALVVEGRVGRTSRVLFLVAAGLTFLIYPLGFHRLVTLDPAAVLVLNLRNGALLALWVVWTFSPVRTSGREPCFGPDRIRKGNSVQDAARPDPVGVL